MVIASSVAFVCIHRQLLHFHCVLIWKSKHLLQMRQIAATLLCCITFNSNAFAERACASAREWSGSRSHTNDRFSPLYLSYIIFFCFYFSSFISFFFPKWAHAQKKIFFNLFFLCFARAMDITYAPGMHTIENLKKTRKKRCWGEKKKNISIWIQPSSSRWKTTTKEKKNVYRWCS